MGIRVGIVEDDAQLRAAFARLVDSVEGLACVGSYATGEEALKALPAQAPDAVLMDINLPGMTGIECTRRLKAVAPTVHVVILTMFDDSERVFESLKAGATGYVLKRAPTSEILNAVRDVCEGGAPMSGAIARKVVQFFRQNQTAPEVEALTDREREVLAALSEGQQYKEIADTLSISINTVRKYIKSIYEKLHVNTRTDAVRKLGRV
ncbi:MAG TPA: response regulator transcription factor [Vicinamibacterales bacterium]|nr:response regulator transcription factor [Vicinamibacterales bacterium]